MVSDNEMPVFVEALSVSEIDSDSDLVYALPSSVVSVSETNSPSSTSFVIFTNLSSVDNSII